MQAEAARWIENPLALKGDLRWKCQLWYRLDTHVVDAVDDGVATAVAHGQDVAGHPHVVDAAEPGQKTEWNLNFRVLLRTSHVTSWSQTLLRN